MGDGEVFLNNILIYLKQTVNSKSTERRRDPRILLNKKYAQFMSVVCYESVGTIASIETTIAYLFINNC